MTPLRQRLIEDLQLHGLAAKTQDAYVRAVRQLAEHYAKSPDLITEEELRLYFLYLKHDKLASPSTFSIALCGLKFFYQHTLQREWTTLELARPAREKKLPAVLSIAEVHQVLGCLHRPHYRVCLTTIYSCGLRLREGVHLQVSDIDGARRMIHVRHGKGGKDRYVPLPEGTLTLLRQYWSTHRHPRWLFPAPTRAGVPMSSATQPMDESGVQRAFRAALRQSGVHKAASVHTLRLRSGQALAPLVRHALARSGRQLAPHSSLSRSQLAPDHRPLHAPHARRRCARRASYRSGDGVCAVTELADILRAYGPAYRAKFGGRMPASHTQVMRAIEQCRTPALGGTSMPVPTAAKPNTSTTRAATGIVPSASTRTPNAGWRGSSICNCPCRTSCSPLRCPAHSGP